MKKYLSAVVTLCLISMLSLTVFASYWVTNEAGGTWERGRNDGVKEGYSYYNHSQRTHGATSVTDLMPGTRSRACRGAGLRAESRSHFEKPSSWKPYWHFCRDTHGGSY